ncbi:gastrula zinc finger protein 5-1 [Culex quinquefasciatus]|uniref:Gastrula zinc finger protein 5-1 n=1 Tax=Culex quinquefasciatus TaxID=7176 RepID=B0WSN0_CULQU|nr:gastrula zinc finger protein 5-1 [Culex quinquefasciatus]|eukprot:XP_001870688.1 gastrula zinc finger protein 5-1 [Culex quinquefasciatus]
MSTFDSDCAFMNLEEICRSCMSKKQKMRPLFGSSLDSMLMTVANVKELHKLNVNVAAIQEVSPNDGFPAQMCVQCVLQVSRAFTFKQQCEKADVTIREHLAAQRANQEKDDPEPELQLITLHPDSPGLEYRINGNAGNECVLILRSIKVPPVEAVPELPEGVPVEDPKTFIVANVESFLQSDEMQDQSREIVDGGKVDFEYNRDDLSCNLGQELLEDGCYRHSRTHLLHKPHVCNICGMSFAESSNLTKHRRKHTGELRNVVGKPNLCPVCGKRFKWTTSLSKHMKHHTKRKVYWCSFPGCGKYYVEQRSLDIHSYSHDDKKPFSCQYCSKGFTQKCNLEKHERVHTGERPFRCNICFKSFAQSGYLVIHQRIHSHERPYSCQECGKQFAASNALTVHLRSHSGVRNYGCDACGKRFSRQETLTIHTARKHSGGERPPHGCVLCEARFESADQLTEHMKSKHGDRFYHMCPSCGKVYASMQSLKNHQKIHLKEGDEGQKLGQAVDGELTRSRETSDTNLPDKQILGSVNFTGENIDVIYD